MDSLTIALRYGCRHWYVLAALLANLAIAGPLRAIGWTDDVCWDDGQASPCCTVCFFFCECEIIQE